jgi:hypothetical protein
MCSVYNPPSEPVLPAVRLNNLLFTKLLNLGDTLFALMSCAPSADELHDTRSEEERQRIIKLLIDEHLHLYAKDKDVDCDYVTVDGKF